MQLIARLILVAVLAAFAVSSVAHAAGSAGMAVDMATSDAAIMDMAGGDACADPESGPKSMACEFVCAAGGFAVFLAPQTERFAQALAELFAPAEVQDFCGLCSPPAKQPPRTLT